MRLGVVAALVLGVAGVSLLCGLGTWQVQRMGQKRVQLEEMAAGISEPAVPVPPLAALRPEADRYRPVTAEGRFTGQHLFVLSGKAMVGAGVQVISVLQGADGRRLLVDRGFLPDMEKNKPLGTRAMAVQGNLMWPRDANQYTPPPDAKTGLWFARDAAAMGAALDAEPFIIVARNDTGDGIEPMPIDTSKIPNDHWGYAITWFLLACVWAVMTVALIWRIRARTA